MLYSRLLALDQAINKTGFSIVELENNTLIKYGVFDVADVKNSNTTNSQDEKIENILKFIDKIVREYEIDFVAIEDIQKQINVKTYKDLGTLQGCIRNYLYSNSIPYTILKPKTWKSDLKIKGKKREEQKANAQKYVKDKYNLEVGEDIADSICINDTARKRLENNTLEIYHELHWVDYDKNINN